MSSVLWRRLRGGCDVKWWGSRNASRPEGFLGVEMARPRRVGRSMSQAEGIACVKTWNHESICLLQERERSWYGRSRGQEGEKFRVGVCLCVLVRPCHDSVKSPPPRAWTKTGCVQLFGNLEPKLPAAFQNSRQCLHQEITKILTQWTKECIFLDADGEQGWGMEGIWEEQVLVTVLASPFPSQWLGVKGSGWRCIPVALAAWIILVTQEQWVLDKEVQVAWELDSLTGALASWLSLPPPCRGASPKCLHTQPVIFFKQPAHVLSCHSEVNPLTWKIVTANSSPQLSSGPPRGSWRTHEFEERLNLPAETHCRALLNSTL